MLIGQYQTNLGAKNRVSLPKKFRIELGDRLIVARWYEKCLVLVSENAWNGLLKKVSGKSKTITSPVRDTERFLIGSAFDFETDSLGRFVIPTVLKEYANLTGEIVFLGLGDRVEIWDKKEWQKREEYISEHAAHMLDELSKGAEENA